MNEEKRQSQELISDPKTWVSAHGDYLYRYAIKRLRNQVVAEDMVQETFLAALKGRHNFTGRSTERTWLVGILKNKIVDHFRKVSREVDLNPSDELGANGDDSFYADGVQAGNWKERSRPGDSLIDSNDVVELADFWNNLSSCLDNLEQRMAVVFVLREMEEMKSEQICNVLDLTPTNLRVLLYRARKQLRICLEKTGWSSGAGND